MEQHVDLGSEEHDVYEPSNQGDALDAEPYDINDIWQLEVNSRRSST